MKANTDGLTMNQLAERNAEHVTTIAALEARCAALVAENAGLKYQEPAGYHVIKECGKVGCSVATLEEAEKTRDFWNKKWTIRPYFYSAPPVQETGVYKDMLDIIGLLENNEWAEHCTSTVLGSFLESEITRLVGKGQPAPVVPEECPAELPYAQVKAVADLYALCWQSGEVVTYTPDPEKATIWLNNYSGTCAQEYVKLERLQEALAGNSPVTTDGWISCSERMPVIGELNWITSFPLLVTCEIGVIPAYYGFVRVNGNKHYGFMESLKYGDDSGNHPQTNEYDLISNVTHWMPLPEPPQEVNRG
ncbi:TPA: DUF551 domain-containing protein [Salmonella enterica subsp. enterica serovar Wandsworth]